MNPSAVLCLAGPTAAGKTNVALSIAQHLGGKVEIISVDSALVYCGMDIGTAKPSLTERALTPHHLIDIHDPAQSYSAAEFARDAQALMRNIAGRGNVTLLVGGTMLYFRALMQGLAALPAASPAVRAKIEQQAARLGWPALHAELARVDPATAARLAPNDSQRIQRALEVYHTTGQALSALHAKQNQEAVPTVPGTGPLPLLSLEPAQRSWLHERIAQRFDAMLQVGLIDEVKALRQRSDLNADLPSMRCVGYRQVWSALDECERSGRPINLTELRERGIYATRQLAKRQITWLRSMTLRHTVACDGPDVLPQVLHWVDKTLSQGASPAP